MRNIDDVIEKILVYQVDGIIAASDSMSSRLAERRLAAQVPMVLFNRSQDEPEMSVVTSNSTRGGRKIADFFVQTGHLPTIESPKFTNNYIEDFIKYKKTKQK